MKRTNKKGFTTVELVIVIAVIAILAAVLIPTFANLIRKANISADTQLAKNLNTALAMDTAENGTPKDFDDVLDAFYENGFVLANMNPTTDGCFLAWEQETNQILLVEITDTAKVLYSAKKGYGDPDDSWYFAVKNQRLAKTITDVLSDVNIEMTILNTTDLNNSINADDADTVHIDGSIVVDENNVIKLDNPNANVTINLGSSKVTGGSTNSAAAAIPFTVSQGKLTIIGGFVNALGQMLDADGEESDYPILTESGTFTKINGTTFNIDTPQNGYLAFCGSADVVGATINSTDMGLGVYDGAQVTVEDTTINATGHGCFFVSGSASKLTVKSGTYKGGDVDGTNYKRACLNAHSGKLVIEGGTFTSNTADMFYIHTDSAQIVIKGGTFNGIAFNSLTKAKLEEMTMAGNVSQNADGHWIISK